MKLFIILISLMLDAFILEGGLIQVELVPVGKVAGSNVALVKKALEGYYPVKVVVAAPVTVPAGFMYPGQTQSMVGPAGKPQMAYDSSIINLNKLSDYLKQNKPAHFGKVVGLTQSGVQHARERWTLRGICLPGPGSSCAIVSTYLVKRQSQTQQAYEFRLSKVALHEFGHTLGLAHCSYSPDCFMIRSTPEGTEFYNSTNKLCENCRRLLQAKQIAVKDAGSITGK